jgi:hypothetical protein
MASKKYFFGWSNIKLGIKEIIKIYSSKDSFFSKKRIESGVGFLIAEWGMVYFLLQKIDTMDIMEFGGWAAIQFFVAGYIINLIQKQKKDDDQQSQSDTEQPGQ